MEKVEKCWLVWGFCSWIYWFGQMAQTGGVSWLLGVVKGDLAGFEKRSAAHSNKAKRGGARRVVTAIRSPDSRGTKA